MIILMMVILVKLFFLKKTIKMIQQKQKPCKGRGLAKGEGCGEEGYYHSMNKGLCTSCWSSWLLNTEAGTDYLNKVQLKAKSDQKHIKRKKKTKDLRELMSVDAYRSKVLQSVINEIVRLIDHGQRCIASGATTGKFSGGHFTSVGANRLIALNVHNIHIQSYHSNGPKGGQPIEYMEGLKKVYGNEYADFILGLRGYKRMHKFKKYEFEQAYKIATKIRTRLKRNLLKRNCQQRIKMRNIVNRALGLYPDSVFMIISSDSTI